MDPQHRTTSPRVISSTEVLRVRIRLRQPRNRSAFCNSRSYPRSTHRTQHTQRRRKTIASRLPEAICGCVPPVLCQDLHAMQASRYQAQYKECCASHCHDFGLFDNGDDIAHCVRFFEEGCAQFHGSDIAHGPQGALDSQHRLSIFLFLPMVLYGRDEFLEVPRISKQLTSFDSTRQFSVEMWWDYAQLLALHRFLGCRTWPIRGVRKRSAKRSLDQCYVLLVTPLI